MSKPVITKRKVLFLPGCKSIRIKAAMALLNTANGVVKTTFDSEDNSVPVEYDLLKINYSSIVDKLIGQKICRSGGVIEVLRTTWFDYLDTTARDIAFAPPAPRCNKPPGRTK